MHIHIYMCVSLSYCLSRARALTHTLSLSLSGTLSCSIARFPALSHAFAPVCSPSLAFFLFLFVSQ